MGQFNEEKKKGINTVRFHFDLLHKALFAFNRIELEKGIAHRHTAAMARDCTEMNCKMANKAESRENWYVSECVVSKVDGKEVEEEGKCNFNLNSFFAPFIHRLYKSDAIWYRILYAVFISYNHQFLVMDLKYQTPVDWVNFFFFLLPHTFHSTSSSLLVFFTAVELNWFNVHFAKALQFKQIYSNSQNERTANGNLSKCVDVQIER